MTADRAYLRFPSIRGDRIAFVAENDVWLADAAGGRAWRLTADGVPVAGARLSPDGATIAFTSTRDGAPGGARGARGRRGVDAADATGAIRTPGSPAGCRTAGWSPSTTAGEPFRSRVWSWALPLDGSAAPERLPYGPCYAVSPGPGGAVVLGTDQRRRRRDVAALPRRHGRQAVDRPGRQRHVRAAARRQPGAAGGPGLGRRPGRVPLRPRGLGQRLLGPPGRHRPAPAQRPRRRVRAGAADRRHPAGLAGARRPLAARRAATRSRGRSRSTWPARAPAGGRARSAPATRSATLAVDRTGRASAVEVLGTVHWLTTRDGPAPALADTPGVRARMPQVLGPAAAAETRGAPGRLDHRRRRRRRDRGRAGRRQRADRAGSAPASWAGCWSWPPPRTAAGWRWPRTTAGCWSPTWPAARSGRWPAPSTTTPPGLAWSPDSAWLAWSHPGAEELRQILARRVADGADAVTVEVTALRFVDTDPVFTLDGLHLAFLSTRTLDPVYDDWVFDLSFLGGTRPYLVPLGATTPSPFHPESAGRPTGDDERGPAAAAAVDADAPPQPVLVDAEAIDQRVVPVPVRDRAGQRPARGARRAGLAGDAAGRPARRGPGDRRRRAQPTEAAALGLRQAPARHAGRRARTASTSTGDGRRLLVRDGDALRVVPADRRVEPDSEGDRDAVVEVDLRRLRGQVDPAAMWRQMYDEAGRLMRDHYWIADMADVDWAAVLDEVPPAAGPDRHPRRPVRPALGGHRRARHLARVREPAAGAGRARPGARPPRRRPGAGRRPLAGGAGCCRASPPSAAPGRRCPHRASAVRAGDEILAVDGRPVDPRLGPAPLLVGAAGEPVELTVQPAGGGGGAPGRGAAAGRREGAALPGLGGRPAGGDARAVRRPGRLPAHPGHGGQRLGAAAPRPDPRGGAGGPGRRRPGQRRRPHLAAGAREAGPHGQGWDNPRGNPAATYPADAPRGPIVAVANEYAGSDGDIVTAGFTLSASARWSAPGPGAA